MSQPTPKYLYLVRGKKHIVYDDEDSTLCGIEAHALVSFEEDTEGRRPRDEEICQNCKEVMDENGWVFGHSSYHEAIIDRPPRTDRRARARP